MYVCLCVGATNQTVCRRRRAGRIDLQRDRRGMWGRR